jgi:hypothetical protein
MENVKDPRIGNEEVTRKNFKVLGFMEVLTL